MGGGGGEGGGGVETDDRRERRWMNEKIAVLCSMKRLAVVTALSVVLSVSLFI